MKRYENFVGLTEVKAAQARVVKYEKKFIDTQELRREAQSKITDIQKKIKVYLMLEADTMYKSISNYYAQSITNCFQHRISTWSLKKHTEVRTGTWC